MLHTITRDVLLIFRRPAARTLVLFGWLAGFAVVPEGLAVPYARTLGGGPVTAGLLMCVMPAGAAAGRRVPCPRGSSRWLSLDTSGVSDQAGAI